MRLGSEGCPLEVIISPGKLASDAHSSRGGTVDNRKSEFRKPRHLRPQVVSSANKTVQRLSLPCGFCCTAQLDGGRFFSTLSSNESLPVRTKCNFVDAVIQRLTHIEERLCFDES